MPTNETELEKNKPVALFTTHYRYFRSTHLERDWKDPEALNGYVLTPYALQSLVRLSQGLKKHSSLRAWRITGDYGSGKSSFALLLANLFAGKQKELSKELLSELSSAAPEATKSPHLLPVLITGSREALGYAILRNLLNALKETGISSSFYTPLEAQLSADGPLQDVQVIDWIKRSVSFIIKHEIANGILLVLDEAGKFLEYATMRPDRQDIYLLQALAEVASRNSSAPLYILSIFHQGIYAYTEGLTKLQQKEWEKVAGRFEEIIWHYPIEQTLLLITRAMQTKTALVSKPSLLRLQKDLERCLKLGWYGATADQAIILKEGEHLYPIHPTVVPVLVKLFALYGQNERSLYSFLLGSEPFSLKDFVVRTEGKKVFRLHNLYDYTKSTFGVRLSSLHYHWKTIDSIIEQHATENNLQTALLKTIGMLNLLGSLELIASREILSLALDEKLNLGLEELQSKRLIYNRGTLAGYGVWSNANVNLADAYNESKKVLGVRHDTGKLIKDRIEERPIVARRHYIETGNLRYFNVRYIAVNDLATALVESYSGDGRILVPLCETPKEVLEAVAFARGLIHGQERTIIVIPPPLQGLASYLEEVRRWEWVERSVPELRQDQLAREEVVRQLSLAKADLQKHTNAMLGFDAVELESHQQWFYSGNQVPHIKSGRAALSFLSDICDRVYFLSPRIHNELVNRKHPSSAAASARLRLCKRLLEFSDEPFLGMNPEKHPPEMSMYLSVMQESGLHTCDEVTGRWNVHLPTDAFDQERCRVLPSMQQIHDLLFENNTKRVSVTALFQALTAPPYGVREGMIPLLLAVFSVLHEHELAFYEDGSFAPRLTGTVFLRLIKAPETFEIQYYPITGVRNTLFHRLVHELEIEIEPERSIDILDVVRPLFIFAASLPEYVLKTNSLSPEAIAVRSLLTKTTDPVGSLFTELPVACGLSPIHSQGKVDTDIIQAFAEKLKATLDELRAAYPALLQRLQTQLFQEFGLTGSIKNNRRGIAQRAQSLISHITEIGLKSFALRLSDNTLEKDAWLESLGNLLASMPPAKWRDRDQHKFEHELHRIAQQFLRVEATIYSQVKHVGDVHSIRVALTLPNGQERGQVIHLSNEQIETKLLLEEELKKLLEKHGHVGMAAASGVLWQLLETNTGNGKHVQG